MTEPAQDRPEQPETAETLPPETPEATGALSVPPPVPRKQPGFFRRLFMTRKQQEAIAIQDGYLEMVDLVRAIRSHLDRQELVQSRVLYMLEKVPDAMDHQYEVLSLFKQQIESNMDNDRRLTDSMGRLSGTLESMNESQKTSSRTITDLITRSRESEQLLREVMRRAERRMNFLILFFVVLALGASAYLVRWHTTGTPPFLPAPAERPAEKQLVATAPLLPMEETADVAETEAEAEPAAERAAAAEAEVDAEPAVDADSEDAVPAEDADAAEPTADEPSPAPESEPVETESAEPEPAEPGLGDETAAPEAEPEAQPVEAAVDASPAAVLEESGSAPEPKPEPRPRTRGRGRAERAEPQEPAASPVALDAPAEEAAPAAVEPEVPEAPAEPPAEPETPVSADESPTEEAPAEAGEGTKAEDPALTDLKAAISEAVQDAFGTGRAAPVSRR